MRVITYRLTTKQLKNLRHKYPELEFLAFDDLIDVGLEFRARPGESPLIICGVQADAKLFAEYRSWSEFPLKAYYVLDSKVANWLHGIKTRLNAA